MSKESSLHHYQGGAIILGHITERINRQPTPDSLVNSWRTILSALRLADSQIDSILDPQKRVQEADLAIRSLENNDPYVASDEDLNCYFGYLRNLLNQLHEEQKQLFIKYLKRLIKVGEKVKEADNPEDYLRYTKLEGQVTARLFLCILPPQFIKDRQAYYRIMTRFARIGNTLDNLRDFEDDRKNGEIAISVPKSQIYLSLLGGIIADLPSVKPLFRPHLFQDLGKCTLQTAKIELDSF